MSDFTPDGTRLDACGCCEPPATVAQLENRPGLTALRYRVGTHASFLRRMLGRIPQYAISSGENQATRPLRALTTRAEDDPSIALLDAWAVTADVLAFYQERIANEGFLAVATERRSVLELARAIGYELSPGVAASTFIGFIVEEPVVIPATAVPPERRGFQGGPGNNAPVSAIVPKGTQIKSIPAPGEKSQTFETSAELEARLEWNALRPQLTRPQPLDHLAKTVWVEGSVTELKSGGRVLFVESVAGTTVATPKKVVSVTAEDELKRTRIELADSTSISFFPVLLKSALTFALPTIIPTILNHTSVHSVVSAQSWKEKDLSVFMSIQKWKPAFVVQHLRLLNFRRATPAPPSFDLDTPEPGLLAFTVKAAAFGNNAPRHDTLPTTQRGTGNPYSNNWDSTPPSIAQSSQLDSYLGRTPPAHFFFERVVNEVLPGGWVLIESGATNKVVRVGAVDEASLADFALSGRVTGAQVELPNGNDVTGDSLAGFKVRATTLHAGSKPLALAQLPIEDPIGSGTPEEGQLTLSGLVLGLTTGHPVSVSGERADLPGVMASEVVLIADVVHSNGFTTLFFQSGLENRYVRATVVLNANVVAATHGETVTEVLGSGNAAIPNQLFRLRKPPLTYVSAATPTGSLNSLQLRVNNVLWQEAPTLYGLEPDDRAFITRIGDEADASIVFGDGKQGARLPTGATNVVATYRSGIGLSGEVDAGSLTILQAKPLGIREAANPVPASGGEDPELLADARSNAPLTVRTLQRIVSLDDYTDFARGFAGVGKAQAVALWTGRSRIIAVTIGSASGEPVAETSQLFDSLNGAIIASRAPLEPFRIGSFQKIYFNVEAKVLVDGSLIVADVMAAVEAALLDAFSFARRDFGQPVTAAEVVTAMHQVAGVVAVDLEHLYLVTEDGSGTAALGSVLPAARTRSEGNQVRDAELLLINPAGITLSELTP